MPTQNPSSTDLLPNSLGVWREAVDQLLAGNHSEQAIQFTQIILRHRPRYLPAYVQMLQAHWRLRRWQDGRTWALRLLRADPTHELAWSTVAHAAEDAGDPVGAHHTWRLAFEQAPYHRTIRAGILRTALGRSAPLTLNRPALATLYRIGGRWQRAAALYSTLVAEQPDRIDLRAGLLESLWQAGQIEAALHLARSLGRQEPNLLLSWLVSACDGDEDDRALAQAPLAALDTDGAYMAARYSAETSLASSSLLAVTAEEAGLLQETLDRIEGNQAK